VNSSVSWPFPARTYNYSLELSSLEWMFSETIRILVAAMKRVPLLVLFFLLLAAGTSGLAQKRITDISGIGPAYGQKLAEAGIKTQDQLLKAASARRDRETLAEKTGISGTLLLKWVNRADLARIKGLGREYADLLEAAGVDSPKELARRNPQNLLDQLKQLNDQKRLVRKLPTSAQIERWLTRAKELTSAVEE
jgi:predicted flap endonuclease-1-like 5' DNA nuclease